MYGRYARTIVEKVPLGGEEVAWVRRLCFLCELTEAIFLDGFVRFANE